jgi:hypothetical protein
VSSSPRAPSPPLHSLIGSDHVVQFGCECLVWQGCHVSVLIRMMDPFHAWMVDLLDKLFVRTWLVRFPSMFELNLRVPEFTCACCCLILCNTRWPILLDLLAWIRSLSLNWISAYLNLHVHAAASDSV